MSEVGYFDSETTGAEPAVDDPIEVAVVRAAVTGPVSWAKRWLARPSRPISPDAIKAHGVTDAEAAKYPPPVEVAPEVEKAMSEDLVVAGYNVLSFDRPLLARWMSEHGARWRPRWVLDLLPVVSRQFREGTPGVSPGEGLTKLDLQAACRRFGVRLESAHSAVFDALACRDLHRKLTRCGALPESLELACVRSAQDAAYCAAEFAKWRWYFYTRDGRTLRVGFGKHIGEVASRVPRGYFRKILESGWELTPEELRLFQAAAAGRAIDFEPPRAAEGAS